MKLSPPLSRLKLRSFWLKLHRFMALTLGLLLALLGLTGSLSLLGEGFDHLFHPSLTIEPQTQPALSLDRVMERIHQAHPDLKGSWTLELPKRPEDPLTALFERPPESFGKLYAPRVVVVHPFTGDILQTYLWGETFRTWLFDLHSQLHAGLAGQWIVGGLGGILILSLVSGMVLWWPPRASWRKALAFQAHASLNPFLLDLHRWGGLVGFPVLLVLALTGMALSFPSLFEGLLGTQGMAHGEKGPAIRSTGQASSHRPVGLDEAILLARGPFSKAEVRLLTTPEDPEDTYRITFRQRGEINDRHPMTAVWVDQYSGQIREVRNALRFSPGERLMSALWPLHTGEIWGGWGRLVYFLAGLLLPLLYASGLTRWLIEKKALSDQALDWSAFRGKLNGYLQRVIALGPPSLKAAHSMIVRLHRHLLSMSALIASWLKLKGSGGG